jgi:uncharacterized protein
VQNLLTWTVAATLVLGFLSGVLAGMFGIGGAVITTPSIRALGATPIHAVGSTVPAILPGSISGAYRYAKSGLVDWRVGLTCGFAGAIFAVAGAAATRLVDAHYLMVLTAGLLGFSGVSIFRSASRSATVSLPPAGPEGDVAETIGVPGGDGGGANDALDGRDGTEGTGGADGEDEVTPELSIGLLAAVGAGAGALAGLLGVGGGIVMMPAFTGLLKLPIRLAVGSSLVAVAIFSVPALVTHTLLGNIDWHYALPLVVGVVPGAQIGARVTLGTSDVVIRRMFGAFLLVVSVVYAVSEIRALH